MISTTKKHTLIPSKYQWLGLVQQTNEVSCEKTAIQILHLPVVVFHSFSSANTNRHGVQFT